MDRNDERSNNRSASPAEKSEFESLGETKQPSIIVEFWWFLRENKRWWLAPIIIAMFLLMLLAILNGSGAAPFIYSLF